MVKNRMTVIGSSQPSCWNCFGREVSFALLLSEPDTDGKLSLATSWVCDVGVEIGLRHWCCFHREVRPVFFQPVLLPYQLCCSDFKYQQYLKYLGLWYHYDVTSSFAKLRREATEIVLASTIKNKTQQLLLEEATTASKAPCVQNVKWKILA